MFDIDVPAYPDTIVDEYLMYTSIRSDGFAGLNIRNGPYGAVSSDALSDGTVHYVCDMDFDRNLFLSEAKWISENFATILDAALNAMVNQYWENREEVLDCFIDEDPNDVVPEIQSFDDLRGLCGIVGIHVKCPGTDGTHRFGIEFGCTWEDEHGAGVRFENLKAVEDGHAAHAFDFR